MKRKNMFFQNKYYAVELALAQMCGKVKMPKARADFISKMSIALKEADETAYWIELLTESEIIKAEQVKSLYDENTEIIKILSAIVKSSKIEN